MEDDSRHTEATAQTRACTRTHTNTDTCILIGAHQ